MNHITWRKSSYSACNGNCLEVLDLPDGGRMVRDSKDQEGPSLVFTKEEWSAFILGAKDGEFDPEKLEASGALQVAGRDGGWLVRHRDDPAGVLRFDAGEVAAFVAGVHDGEFDAERLTTPDTSGSDASGKAAKAPVADEGPLSVAR